MEASNSKTTTVSFREISQALAHTMISIQYGLRKNEFLDYVFLAAFAIVTLGLLLLMLALACGVCVAGVILMAAYVHP